MSMKNNGEIEVISPGILTLLTDLGRYGQHRLGLTTGGPMDLEAFTWANLLCGNQPNLTALEVTLGGLEIIVREPTQIALTGAPGVLRVNCKEIPMWQSHFVTQGDRLSINAGQFGLRSYIAIAGGFSVHPIFDSTSTVVRERIGGLYKNGLPLKAGDVLHSNPAKRTCCLMADDSCVPRYSDKLSLRLVTGYQFSEFALSEQHKVFSNEFRVTDRMDRMGVQLAGTRIKNSGSELLSEGICYGAVQVPADGQPIIMLNDRQTIGGYPKLGSVLSLDCFLFSQLRSGAKVRFEALDMLTAHNLLHLNKYRQKRLVAC